ncbi:MAG TPA: cysteine-rich CWC family protein [Ferruginibacter sp.]|nr:cysteine-rich CWC family protein [Ferruginibacter sp.]HMP22296.1 cysteine-rich CWC family protein [Ferruginibacter sp.]
MCKHEQKSCPRCGAVFECKTGDINNCQCFGVELSVAEETFIASHYNDCLCRNCLLQLKQRYTLFTEQEIFYKYR